MGDLTGKKIVALAGGVGGARLTYGLAKLLPPENFSVIVNTGDDFEYWGLTICPDLDTVMYSLAGLNNPLTGWGLLGETFNCLDTMEKLGYPTWFRLGDKDLATHITRTNQLQNGKNLTETTDFISKRLGVEHQILPMCDYPYRTIAITENGEMDFQTYFVKEKWQPKLNKIRWNTSDEMKLNPILEQRLIEADIFIFCPSNPFVSIDPILSFPQILQTVQSKTTVAVSPIIGGEAVKGPAAKMFSELIGKKASAKAVAEYYQNRFLLNGFMFDKIDKIFGPEIKGLNLEINTTDTLMRDSLDQIRLADELLTFISDLV